jgi:hypothetical protein
MQTKTLLVSTVIVFACLSCTKEKLNDHDTILDTWYVKKITGLNGFSNTTALDFASGEYTFKQDGSLEYLNWLRILYKGSWLLYENQDETYTGADGSVEWTDGGGAILELDADKTTAPLQKKKAYFIRFNIIDANNFTAYLCLNAVVTHEYSFVRLK